MAAPCICPRIIHVVSLALQIGCSSSFAVTCRFVAFVSVCGYPMLAATVAFVIDWFSNEPFPWGRGGG